jgi:NADPH:quinone reductase-like Zn-dependent oxidoreductase
MFSSFIVSFYKVFSPRETKPIPHIPGAEIAGEVEKTGKHVTSIKQGDRVVVVLNSLGVGTWDSSYASVGIN